MRDDKQTKFYLVIPTILFFSFLTIFMLTAILSLLSLFFGIGELSEKRKNILFFMLILQIGVCIITLFKSSFKRQVTGTKWGDIFIHPYRTSLLEHIAPLKSIEQRFLQVLVFNFRLKRKGFGVHLEVTFANDALAIWTDGGKREIGSIVAKHPDVNIDEVQSTLNQVLIAHDKDEYEYNSERCPFRYASGGALPIVTIGETQYYCLIYREVPPVGWNIANGGCDSRDELLNPGNTIVRELNEELIIIDPGKGIQYFYEKFHDLPDHNMVREHLRKHFPRGFFEDLKTEDALTSFEEGPDKLTVSIIGGGTNDVEGCFVNINATDNSIELDKIAHIKVGKEAIFIDGEIAHYYPIFDIVNAPIGLFKKEDFDEQIRTGSREFIPDVFFWNARRHPDNIKIDPSGIAEPVIEKEKVRSELFECIKRFIVPKRAFMQKTLKQFDSLCEKGEIYDLCPVTRSLVRRFLQTQGKT